MYGLEDGDMYKLDDCGISVGGLWMIGVGCCLAI